MESAIFKWVDRIPQHLKMGISEMTIGRQKLYLGWSLQKENPSLVGITLLQSFENRKGKCGLKQRKGKEKIWLGPKRKPPHNETQQLTSALLFSSTSRLDCRTQLLLGSRPNLPNTTSTERDKQVSFQLQSHLLEICFLVSEPTSSLKNNHLRTVWHSMPCNTYYSAGTKLNQENKFETQVLCAPEFTVTLVLKEVTCWSI